MDEWFIVPLIGGLYFFILGIVAISISIRKKREFEPLILTYVFGGLAIFIISYIKY